MTQQPSPAPPERPDQPTEPATQPPPPDQLPELPDQLATAPPPPPAPTPPRRKRRVWPYVTIGVVVVIALLVAGGAFLLRNLLQEEVPQVGECLDNAAAADDMEVVACDSAGAAWTVIGNDGTWTRGDFDAAGPGEVCQAFAETQQALWVTSSATVDAQTEGEVICLAPAG